MARRAYDTINLSLATARTDVDVAQGRKFDEITFSESPAGSIASATIEVRIGDGQPRVFVTGPESWELDETVDRLILTNTVGTGTLQIILSQRTPRIRER